MILPKVGLPTMLPGGPKLAWLNRSKTSTRSCKRSDPRGFMFFATDRSVFRKPGPMTALRVRLPKRLTATKADVSNHWSTEPMIRMGPTTSGYEENEKDEQNERS